MIKLGKFLIGEGQPVRVIAEIADNHGGSVAIAKNLILAAKESGADIVKFQLHLPDEEMVPGSIQMWDGPLYDILQQNLLTIEQHQELKEFCEENDIMYLATPFCSKAADLLEGIGVAAYKTGSGEITNLPMLIRIAKKGKPMIVSTGMAEWTEIKIAADLIKKEHCPLILMNCTSEYPPRYEDINLGLIKKMEQDFGVPAGHSDHTPDIYTALAAVAMGAKIIEKHFTLDKTQKGPDHFISLEPQELKQLVGGIRKIEKALGAEKKVHDDEQPVRFWAFHSVVAARDIPLGRIIAAQDIVMKRPGSGIPASQWQKVIGRQAERDIKKNEMIRWTDLAA